MNSIRVIILVLVFLHMLPIAITQLLVMEYPFDKWENGRIMKWASTAVNVLLNGLAFSFVFTEYGRATGFSLIEILNFTCSYQDISRLATSNIICLVISVFIGIGEYIGVCIYYRDKHFLRFSSKYVLLLSLAAIPVTLGYYYGHSATFNLAFHEICRKTSTVDPAVDSWDEDALDEGGSYVVIKNNGVLAYELDQMYLSDNEDQLQGLSLQQAVIGPGKTHLFYMLNKNSINIKKNGGSIVYLSDKYRNIVDSVEVPALKRNESYINTEADWQIVNCAKTGKNTTVPAPYFSKEGGFYDDPFYLTLSAEEGTKIYYTVDSATPTENSLPYSNPIFIYNKTPEPNVLLSKKNIAIDYYNKWSEQANVDKAFVVRAVAVDREGNTSDTVTKTYFVDLNQYAGQRIISLVTDPDNLFGKDGIYITGDAYDEWYENAYAKLGKNDEPLDRTNETWANFQKRGIDWERDANLEAFSNTNNYLNQPVGIRIQGATARNNMIKRFSVYARKDYSGSKYFERSPFDNSDEFVHSIVFRDGFINAFSQALITDRSITSLEYTPATVFLNGEFLTNTYMQEKYSEGYFAKRYGLSEDNIELLKIGRWSNLTQYEQSSYLNSISNYIEGNDLSDSDRYDAFGKIIDIQSYIDYSCVSVYLGNIDMTDRANICLWRTNTKENEEYGDKRWRWALYDMDLHTKLARWARDVKTNAEVNTFTDAPSFSKDRHYNENPIYSALKANPLFYKQYVTTFMDLVNTTFSVENVSAKFDEWDEYTIESYDDGFFLNRARYIVPYMAEEFELTGTQEEVTLSANISGAPITLNTISPELRASEDSAVSGAFSWTGSYFTDYPVTVTAGAPGFSHWEITADENVQRFTDTTIEVPVSKGGVQIHAVFQ